MDGRLELQNSHHWRHHPRHLDEFTNILEKINKENKTICIMGDYNIDILKHEEHNETQNFLDMIYENNLIPLITKPTRLTCYS